MKQDSILQLDRQHVWHPYTLLSTLDTDPMPVIVRGEGVFLFDQGGTKYLDAISSWWGCALGHSHPKLIAAIQRQVAELQHSILGNLTHLRAIELAAKLATLMPTPERHVMFASDGSSAVEAALKIALQYWHNIGRGGRHRFVALDGGYHGDTLGAVSVGYMENFHKPFQNSILGTAIRTSAQKDGFASMAAIIEAHGDELAAVIVEPMCQCAAGMKMYPDSYLVQLAKLCQEKDILLIVDEIATGFGRTGKMFAFEHANIDPDIVCVGKALSAGYQPISATIVKDRIYDTFTDWPVDHSFYHGHTFCGNPIAAATSLAALKIYITEHLPKKAKAMEAYFEETLIPLSELRQVQEVRCFGAIAAVELRTPNMAHQVRWELMGKRIIIRPLGNVVYLMPPLNISQMDLEWLVHMFVEAIRTCG